MTDIDIDAALRVAVDAHLAAEAEIARLRDALDGAEAEVERLTRWAEDEREAHRIADAAIARVDALCDKAEREQGCTEALLNSDHVRAALRG